MPVFTRRRLQMMLNSLAQVGDKSKQRDFIARLSSKRTKDAIAAEMEVAILWGINEVSDLEIEPTFPNTTTRPDAGSVGLFGEREAVIEITTVSDDFLGGEDAMRRVSTRFAQFANKLTSKAENHLYFTFEEESRYVGGQYERTRLVNPAYVLTGEHKQLLRSWLGSGVPPSPVAIRVVGDKLDVTIEWREFVHPQFNFFTTMPPVTYSLEDNSVYKSLKRKEDQLPTPENGALRCIFVADGGCSLIRYIGSTPMGQREIYGEQIIEHFLRTSAVDVVCTFSPTRASSLSDRIGKLKWAVQLFGANVSNINMLRMEQILPLPKYEAYQARSLHLQNAFHPQERGQYLGSYLRFNGDDTVAKFSARALHELLAGRIDLEVYEHQTRLREVFERQLVAGKTIQEISLETGGIDSDDDFVQIVFGDDPAAGEFREQPEPGS